MLRGAVLAGSLPAAKALQTMRKKGWEASPFPRGDTHSPPGNHVEHGDAYFTLTHRARFLIDRAWSQEAGEELPAHKEPRQ